MYKILLIEDDLDFAAILAECLTADPEFEILDTISSREGAQSRFDAGILHNVDTVLLDIQLPISDHNRSIESIAGINLLREMRVRHRFEGQIIVLTNSTSPAHGEMAMEHGCDGYLCKHVRINDLAALMSELRMAIRGDVMLVSREMRHVFMRSGPKPAVEAPSAAFPH